MAQDPRGPLTPVNEPGGTLPASRLLVFALPVIVAATITAAMAALAAVLRWNRDEMLVIASVAGIAAAVPAILLLIRQRAERVAAERALESSEARLSGLVESAMDAIIAIDEDQRIVLFNAAAEAVFGCPRAEALGAPLAMFIPARFHAAHAGHVQRFGADGVASRRMGESRVVMGLRRSGEEFPIDASISQIVEGGHRFYTVILRDVTQRWFAERALEASREEARSLALAAATAREDEKRRMARELHDELGQSLTALKIDLVRVRGDLADAPGPVAARLDAMRSLLDFTVSAARRISSELRPMMLDDLGLGPACEWLGENFRKRTGIPCEMVLDVSGLDLPDHYSTAVFRVLQESLTNITKHAEATQVEVTLERTEREITLTVRDNGRGFEPGGPRKSGSHGFTGLRERAVLLDGRLEVHSAPGRGTVIELSLPLSGIMPANTEPKP